MNEANRWFRWFEESRWMEEQTGEKIELESERHAHDKPHTLWAYFTLMNKYHLFKNSIYVAEMKRLALATELCYSVAVVYLNRIK